MGLRVSDPATAKMSMAFLGTEDTLIPHTDLKVFNTVGVRRAEAVDETQVSDCLTPRQSGCCPITLGPEFSVSHPDPRETPSFAIPSQRNCSQQDRNQSALPELG